MENPSHLHGPEYDAYQIRMVAEELEDLDVVPLSAMVEIERAYRALERIVQKTRRAA